MVDVAVVRGTIRFDVQGVAQAQTQIEALQNRINAMGQAAAQAGEDASGFAERFAAASPELRRLTREIEILQGRVVAFGPAIAEMRQEAEALAPSLGAAVHELQAAQGELAQLGAAFRESGVNIEAARQAMSDIEHTLATSTTRFDEATAAKLRYRAVARTLPKALQENEEAAREVVEQIRRYVDVEENRIDAAERAVAAHEKLNAAEKRQINTERQLETAVKRTNRELDKVERIPGAGAGAGGGGPGGRTLSQTELSGMVRLLRTGRVPTELLGRAFLRLASAAKAVLPAIGAIAGPAAILVAGFKIASSEAVQFGQRLAGARPEIRGMYEDLEELAGFDGAALLSFLEQATNRLKSFGAADPTGTAGTIAELANIGQFRLPGVGDAPAAAQAIQRAVESISFDPLRDLGVPVDELNSKLNRLARDGMDKASRQAFVLNEIANELNQDVLSGEAAARANAEFNTMAGVMQEIKRIFASIGEDEALVAAAQEFTAALRDSLPLLQGIAEIAANIGTILVGAATEFTQILRDPVDTTRQNIRGALGAPEGQSILGTIFGGDSNLPEGAHMGGLFGRELVTSTAAIDDANESAQEWIDVHGRAATASDRFGRELKAVEDIVDGFNDTMNETDRELEKIQRRGEGFGLIGSARGLADAFAAMDDSLNFTTVGNTLRQFDTLMTQVLDNGIESIDLMRLQAQRLNEVGLLPDDALAESEDMFRALEHVLAPIEEEANRIKERMGEQASAQGMVTSAAGETNTQLSAAGGIIASNIALTHEWAGVLGSISVQNPLGLPGVGGVPFATPPTGGGTLTPEQINQLSNLPRTGRPNAELADKRLQRQNRRATTDGSTFDFDAWREQLDRFATPRGGGGGGGGGGSDLASIEEIRRLFRNINQLIKIGVNEGTFFSPAGNTIPRGGPNEFLNREGGVLVQTVNIRGIWDFADPAAKRQIIKELEEALAGLKKEVA